jgi:hypothetical protein
MTYTSSKVFSIVLENDMETNAHVALALACTSFILLAVAALHLVVSFRLLSKLELNRAYTTHTCTTGGKTCLDTWVPCAPDPFGPSCPACKVVMGEPQAAEINESRIVFTYKCPSCTKECRFEVGS